MTTAFNGLLFYWSSAAETVKFVSTRLVWFLKFCMLSNSTLFIFWGVGEGGRRQTVQEVCCL